MVDINTKTGMIYQREGTYRKVLRRLPGVKQCTILFVGTTDIRQ